jgi:hypothetical protein
MSKEECKAYSTLLWIKISSVYELVKLNATFTGYTTSVVPHSVLNDKRVVAIYNMSPDMFISTMDAYFAFKQRRGAIDDLISVLKMRYNRVYEPRVIVKYDSEVLIEG